MLMTNLFNDFFEDVFSNAYRPFYAKEALPAMKTDIKAVGENFEMEIELPGCAKEDLSAKLDKGYLTISAKHSEAKDEKDESGQYIRRERYRGEMSRTFFVGENLKEEDIKAKFENGILKLTIPQEAPKQIEPEKFIAIEG